MYYPLDPGLLHLSLMHDFNSSSDYRPLFGLGLEQL